jgi:hypothetical protein
MIISTVGLFIFFLFQKKYFCNKKIEIIKVRGILLYKRLRIWYKIITPIPQIENNANTSVAIVVSKIIADKNVSKSVVII